MISTTKVIPESPRENDVESDGYDDTINECEIIYNRDRRDSNIAVSLENFKYPCQFGEFSTNLWVFDNVNFFFLLEL